MSIEIPGAGGKMMLICNTGGHLTELLRVERRIGAHPDSMWVTFDTMQSRELLHGRRVHHLSYTGPRDVKGTLRAAPVIRRLLRQERPDAAISTGAAIAVAALPVAAMSGIPSTYVESVSRLHGPSTTGRLLQMIPGVGLRTQHAAWASHRWRLYPSILGDYRSEPVERRTDDLKIFVTLGTIRGYRFDSAVDAVLRSGMANSDTVWQLGYTTRTDSLPGTVFDHLAPGEFADAAMNADVVITHAGAGTLLELLDLGIYPVQAVRRAVRREHVDDHQAEIGELVNSLDLGMAVDGPDLTADVIRRAAQRRVVDATRVREVRS